GSLRQALFEAGQVGGHERQPTRRFESLADQLEHEEAVVEDQDPLAFNHAHSLWAAERGPARRSSVVKTSRSTIGFARNRSVPAAIMSSASPRSQLTPTTSISAKPECMRMRSTRRTPSTTER